MRLKVVLLVAQALFFGHSFSQTDLMFGFNSNHDGRSVFITSSKTFREVHEIGGGLRFNINRTALPDDQNKIYYKRLYATEPLHFFGANFFYHRSILNNWEHIKPFVFYDFQASYSTAVYPKRPSSELESGYRRFTDPFTWLNQNIGIGFKVDLSSNFFLFQKLGAGVSFILGRDQQLLSKQFNGFDWEFGYVFNVGLGYRFNKN